MRFGIEKYYYKADSDERANGQRDRRRNYGLGGGLEGRRRVDDAVFFPYLRAATFRISPTQVHHNVRGALSQAPWLHMSGLEEIPELQRQRLPLCSQRRDGTVRPGFIFSGLHPTE